MAIIQTSKPLAKRHTNDFYETPLEFCRVALSRLNWVPTVIRRRKAFRILDIGAGTGHWGVAARELWPKAHISGLDITKLSKPASYDDWFVLDITQGYRPKPIYDLVIGNPPYKYAEEAVEFGISVLGPDSGKVFYLLPLNFLAGYQRYMNLYLNHRLDEVVVSTQRIPFTNHIKGRQGKTDDREFAMYLWSKHIRGNNMPNIMWMTWRPYGKRKN